MGKDDAGRTKVDRLEERSTPETPVIYEIVRRVGEDEMGNVYYEGGTNSDGQTRRWVIYNGYSEGSAVPPGWHGWLHHRVDTPPSAESYRPREWQKPHLPNLTGSPAAYRPPGSILGDARRPQVTGDYDAWTPGS